MRVVVTEAELGPSTPPTLDDLRRELVHVFGTDFGVHDPTWLSRFTDATRQATTYRAGRILLAGDAAHVHAPTGGLGIGLGIQDAVNLGWKLGQVVRGDSGEGLLDTYHAERHPAGARALKFTMAQSLFQKADPRQEALRDLIDEVLRVDDAGAPIAALISGLDVATTSVRGTRCWDDVCRISTSLPRRSRCACSDSCTGLVRFCCNSTARHSIPGIFRLRRPRAGALRRRLGVAVAR